MGKNIDLGQVTGELYLHEGYANDSVRNNISSSGALGWYYKDFAWSRSTLTFGLTICNAQGETVDAAIEAGDEFSFKADYSANFCGTVTGYFNGTIWATLYAELPSNWLPEKHEYDYDETAVNPGRGYVWIPAKPALGVVKIGEGACAVGSGNKANELGAFASGRNNLADGRYSFASGDNNKAGYACHVEGQDNVATELFAHAEGKETEATGYGAHSEGRLSKAWGKYAHAEGYNTKAEGENSHAEGKGSRASGVQSHAEGLNTVASGKWGAHSEGESSKAVGNSSHAEGLSCETGNVTAQHVQGKYNVVLGSSYADIVGWGSSSSSKKNISVLDTSGNLYLAKDIYVNATNANGYTGARKIEDKVFVITKGSGTTVDRSYDEIQAADEAGRPMILVASGIVYVMDVKSSGSYYFTSVQYQRSETNFSGMAVRRFIINSSGELTTSDPSIRKIMPNPPASGTYTLKSVNGVLQWVQ